MTKLKYQILSHIASGYCYSDNPTYEQMLEAVYENSYKTIEKVPVNVFLLGNVESFVLKDVEHANKVLDVVKQVVIEALEVSGIEVTFTDEEWFKLQITENTTRWGGKYLLNNSKGYMYEFFEL